MIFINALAKSSSRAERKRCEKENNPSNENLFCHKCHFYSGQLQKNQNEYIFLDKNCGKWKAV